MIKLLAFDIDNTLAEINEPIQAETIRFLKRFEESGIKVAFVSGKPAIYISGMVRQVGLREPIIIGENGLNIYYGCQVPPLKVIDAKVEQTTIESLLTLKKGITKVIGDIIWYQPNEICVTAFPKTPDAMPELQATVHNLFEQLNLNKHLVYYQHSDSIDIAPKNTSKGSAMKTLYSVEGWNEQEVIAIGDGENDIPLFENAGYTIGVNFKGNYTVDAQVTSVLEAMNVIEDRIRFEPQD